MPLSNLHTLPAATLAPTPSRANDFYELTKPRMNFLVLVTTAVGFYMAVGTPGDWRLLLHTLIGTALSAASAAVLNQVIEREHDKLMPRTRNRPLPTGRVGMTEAMLYGIALGVIGVVELAVFVNVLTASLGLLTVLSYLFIYTPMKRTTSLNTVVGAVPGAIPPMMGWTAVHNDLRHSPEALALFAILFIWQIPHFLAIATMYKGDYAAGGFMMLPVVDSTLAVTGRQIVLYAAVLIPISLAPTLLGMCGAWYFFIAIVLGLAYLWCGVIAAKRKQRVDARRLFFCSILYLPLLLAAMMLNKR